MITKVLIAVFSTKCCVQYCTLLPYNGKMRCTSSPVKYVQLNLRYSYFLNIVLIPEALTTESTTNLRLSTFEEVQSSLWPFSPWNKKVYLYIQPCKIWPTESQIHSFHIRNIRSLMSNHCDYQGVNHRTFDKVQRSLLPLITIYWQKAIYVRLVL